MHELRFVLPSVFVRRVEYSTAEWRRKGPQGLKPLLLCLLFGRAEARPSETSSLRAEIKLPDMLAASPLYYAHGAEARDAAS